MQIKTKLFVVGKRSNTAKLLCQWAEFRSSSQPYHIKDGGASGESDPICGHPFEPSSQEGNPFSETLLLVLLCGEEYDTAPRISRMKDYGVTCGMPDFLRVPRQLWPFKRRRGTPGCSNADMGQPPRQIAVKLLGSLEGIEVTRDTSHNAELQREWRYIGSYGTLVGPCLRRHPQPRKDRPVSSLQLVCNRKR